MGENKTLLDRLHKAVVAYVNSLSYEQADYFKKGGRLIPKHKSGSGIHIKPENKGKFTASAKKAGQSVQEHAKSVLNNPNATPLQKKRANFARNAAKWKHAKGGVIKSLENFDAQSFRKWLDENYGQPN